MHARLVRVCTFDERGRQLSREKSESLGFGGSMVAKLKLKGIDGKAPQGVELAA